LPHATNNGAISAFVKLSTEANDIALAEVQALTFFPSTFLGQAKKVESHQSGKLCLSSAFGKAKKTNPTNHHGPRGSLTHNRIE
jgi:hypothetical protein